MAKDEEKKEAAAAPKVEETVVVQNHKNIYEALSAFQGENPTITKSKEFGKAGDKMHWWYAPLDEVLKIVRPLLYKHGLSLTWTEGKNSGEMIAVLYHSTYSRKQEGEKKTTTGSHDSVNMVLVIEPLFTEENVIRSMPITVNRKGDMKAVGGDSTYARRYTGAEVLGIAPDEDNDIMAENERLTKVEGFAFKQAMSRVTGAKNEKALEEHVAFFTKELTLLEEKKQPSLGFTKEQYEELTKAAADRGKVLRGEDEPSIDITTPSEEPGK